MLSKSLKKALRDILSQWVEKLGKDESSTPRSVQTKWWQVELHVPPIIVSIASCFVLFGVLIIGSEFNVSQMVALAIFVAFSTALFALYLKRDHPLLSQNDDAMSLLAVIFFLTVFLIKFTNFFSPQINWLSPYLTPVSLAPFLVALLLHARLAVVVSFIVSVLFGLINNFSLELTLVSAVGCFSAVALVAHARTAHEVARAGILVGLVQLSMVFFLAVMESWSLKSTWIDLISVLGSGIVASFLCLGALPFLENFFSRISNLRLVELSDANHPLLRKLSLEAPGTYHHSQVVAALAESAANGIGANGLLCRVGAYYHDIGKTVKAEYFVENQSQLGNPHDAVSPSLSRLIITSHVKEGVALAKEHKLDQQVINFIPMHHGTSKIEYFYHKALKLEESEDELEKEEISAESYRYPGPRPNSKETGIVMLADSVEAAGRTIEEPNHQRFKDLVYKIINKKLADGQLDETPLTLHDLHVIGEKFTSTLKNVHHERVPYPEALTREKRSIEGELTPPR